MTSAGGLTGLWMVAFLTLHGANFGETHRRSPSEVDVPFPPARPTAQNLAAICRQGQGQSRYPAGFFPRSRGSRYQCRGNAINRLESWYHSCCSGQVAQQRHQVLCCAHQAWKQAVSQFCMEEHSITTLPESRGDAQVECVTEE